ncbi:mechanosensitive ion channel [Sphingobacterium sp. UT-1RO-CII-1]|uniref:mechanosensitive ion channel domain-containing protein n=1 Tax=Sphingobacterium sp. UT-1RO-CII-1 TaxID=2995225 RepID=UPI002279F990|nr:mechanosensitive ion channel domain-containing protein [Sphingobacterium sp. UT-1RO-CII-1]MCY4779449.1 mechanosensitive ion channel [Sphingobacterium sp. UT-1RO-CII-1]
MANLTYRLVTSFFLLFLCVFATAQKSDSSDYQGEVNLLQVLQTLRQQQIIDSLERKNLREELNKIKVKTDEDKLNLKKHEEELELVKEQQSKQFKERVDSIRANSKGYAVAPFNDTLFYVYAKLGSTLPIDRAFNVKNRIQKLADDDLAKVDSFKIEKNEISVDIVYNDLIITSVTDLDALFEGLSKDEVAEDYLKLIKDSVTQEREDSSIPKLLIRIGLVVGILLLFFLFIKLLLRLKGRLITKVVTEQERRLKDIKIRNYVIVSSAQKVQVLKQVFRLLYWAIVLLVAFLMLPVIFSIFPFTQGWANQLISLITKPLNKTFSAVIAYIPDLITALVILFVMRYLIRFVKYIFAEIDRGNLEISGFHQEFAMPTFTIVRFLLYAFTMVLIFPYLPGANSDVFKGVSVFIGVLFSLGSSSAISNIVAGLVITYMRPFRIGDRITIADKTGIVLEKTALVTRLRTIKNEEITIPNSSILTGNTVNYSTFSEQGICFQVEVAVGYEEPWTKIQEILLAIPSRLERVKTDPPPFVLQKKLDDFYVLYELNVYISKSGEIDLARSEIYQEILNDFSREDIELNAPHLYAGMDFVPQYKAKQM